MEPYRKKKIVRDRNNTFDETEDILAVEKRLRVYISGEEIISFYCTPALITELLTGFFFTQGLLNEKLSAGDLNIFFGDEIKVHVVTPSLVPEKGILIRHLGGISIERIREFEKVTDQSFISAGALQVIFSEFQERSELFRLTGCFHSAAISDEKEILSFAEDVGRHNAVDKVIGSCILNDIPFAQKLLLVSCRISSEIVSKCLGCGIPFLASVAAPTDLAVDMAEKHGITLVGFVKPDRLNIYTNFEKIIR
jgi:FdhD protein